MAWLHQHEEPVAAFDELDVASGTGRRRYLAGVGAGLSAALHRLEGEEHARVVAEAGVELGGDVDERRFARGVLDDEEEFRHDLDDMTCLQDEVALPLDVLRGQAARDVGVQAVMLMRIRMMVVVVMRRARL